MKVVINKELTGEDAIRYLGAKYDWNVYCPDYNRMCIIAYRQKREDNGGLVYDGSWEVIFRQEMTVDWSGFIGTVLRDDDWSSSGWYEYDSWEGDTEWLVQLCRNSSVFTKWFEENIVDYEIK